MPNAIRFEVHRHPRTALPRRVGKRLAQRTSRRLSRILAATDGTAASEGAVIVAGLLARRHQATVDVVSVLPRWGESPPAHEFMDITGELLERRLASVIPQGQRALANGTRFWAIRLIESGSAVDGIADTARAERHDLIVTGKRHDWIARWFRRPTALAVARRSGVPVLVVPDSISTLPARAVVGVDGTDSDVAIARTTFGLLADNAAVHLVHVDNAAIPLAGEAEDRESSEGWSVKFAHLERAIADAGITNVHRVILRGGEPTRRLAAYADGVNAELIVSSVRPRTTIAERFSSGAGGRFLRASDRAVLLYEPGK